MTTHDHSDTIAVSSSTTDGSRTMMKADTVTAMKALHAQGHSATKIGKLLGCGRNTVLRCLRKDFETPCRAQPPGVLDAHKDFLLERFLRHDGNADVVHQELKAELGIDVSLRTVQRALKPHRERLRAAQLLTPRFETKPGEQMQIDFGVKTVTIEGRKQAIHLFVATLGYSRRIFAKASPEETQGAWLGGTEAAFAHFGGVPKTVLMDNAKALVTTPRQDDKPPIFNERLKAFARYWDFKPRACRPYRARTKGKVERSVRYVKDNALAGRTFASWGALDRHLATWLATVADHRTLDAAADTPLSRFEAERAQLAAVAGKPPFGAPRELERTVNADAMIELDTNRYSVPWQHIRTRVQVAPTATTIRIYAHGQLIAEHARCEGRHQRRRDQAHVVIATPPTVAEPQDDSLVRPLTEYDAYVANQVWAPEEVAS